MRYTTFDMAHRTSVIPQLDPRAIEERTQAIGHALFAAAKREHARLSALNRWTAQVLSWCLSDPAVKSAVLRFIDVLPSLRSPRDIAQHVREYFPTTSLRFPAALRLGASLARPGLLTHGALAVMIRQLVEHVARQFIAESHPEAARHALQQLSARGATCSLDILGEQVLTESEADRYLSRCRALLGIAAAQPAMPSTVPTCGPRANLSVKPSALTPRFDPISPRESIERAFQRLQPLLDLASEHEALINLDMEHCALRDLTLDVAKRALLSSEHGGRSQLGIVIQAYLRDSEETVEQLLGWLMTHERALTIRLVKGAYWDVDLAQAQQRQWPIPVYIDKAETDLAFERLTRRLLSASPLVTTAIASHNVRSIAHAMAVAETLGLSKQQLEFQLLYGMGDAIHAAIVSLGFPVRIYTPVGELIPGMAYLVRRLLENTANESFLRQEYVQERSADELLHPPAPSIASTAVRSLSPPTQGWHGEPWRDFSREDARRRMAEALASVREQRGRSYPLLIGPDEVQSGLAFTVRNPAAPDEAIGIVAKATAVEVDRAVRLAAAAQPGWARLPVEERVQLLRRTAALMREERDELAAWSILEVGKTWREADLEIVEAIEYLEYYSQQMLEFAGGKPLLQLPGERNTYRYLPRGVAVVISPWNFPAAILTGMASAALVTGNAVILKPAKPSSVIAAHIARILRAAGIPPGVVQFLPGSGEEVGARLVQHPGTHALLFTGSKAVGLSLIETCARVPSGQRFIKHAITEMGGKNALIIDADADLDAAILGTMTSAFGYAGQKCSAASRLIVHEAISERFLARLIEATDRLVVGDPADPATDVGPLVEESAQRRLQEAIARAKQVATVAYEYPAARLPTRGYFAPPTIVTDVPREDRLAREELFGPLLCVFRVKSFEEAVALANDTDYALTGGVYSRSPAHLDYARQSFDVGNLYLNRPTTGAMVGRQPFGGHRLSGLGTKAGGPEYLLQLVIPQTICENTARHGMPLE